MLDERKRVFPGKDDGLWQKQVVHGSERYGQPRGHCGVSQTGAVELLGISPGHHDIRQVSWQLDGWEIGSLG